MSPRANSAPPIPEDVLHRCADALRVLAHPNRLRVVEMLMEHELTVSEIADRLEIPQAACSQHLSRMRAAGLLRASREGREVYYEVDDPAAANVIQCIRDHME